MRILVTATHAPFLYGGGERHMQNLCAALRQRGPRGRAAAPAVQVLPRVGHRARDVVLRRLRRLGAERPAHRPGDQPPVSRLRDATPAPRGLADAPAPRRLRLFDESKATPERPAAPAPDRRLRQSSAVGCLPTLRQFAPPWPSGCGSSTGSSRRPSTPATRCEHLRCEDVVGLRVLSEPAGVAEAPGTC